VSRQGRGEQAGSTALLQRNKQLTNPQDPHGSHLSASTGQTQPPTCGCTRPPCRTSSQTRWGCTRGSTGQKRRSRSATSCGGERGGTMAEQVREHAGSSLSASASKGQVAGSKQQQQQQQQQQQEQHVHMVMHPSCFLPSTVERWDGSAACTPSKQCFPPPSLTLITCPCTPTKAHPPVGCVHEVVRIQQPLLKHILACLPGLVQIPTRKEAGHAVAREVVHPPLRMTSGWGDQGWQQATLWRRQLVHPIHPRIWQFVRG